jgi:tetratricopeptide (TPR) repeat protein
VPGSDAPISDSSRSSGSVFVGRERHLRELVGGLDDAVAGRGRLFLIGGEPGVGKTRLADELAAAAGQRGVRTVWGRAWQDAGAPPYWPWIQTFRAYLRGVDADVARQQLGLGAADLVQVLPEIAAIVPGLTTPSTADPEASRFRLFDSAATFLVNAARENALVVLFDDLQDADTASLLLLRFLAGQLRDSRLLIVATYRSFELTPDHPLTPVLEELNREPATSFVALDGLDERATGQLIEALAGTRPSQAIVSAIWRETTGNPLFLGEAIRLLGPAGRLDPASGVESPKLSVPAAIRRVITRRIELLGDQPARILRIGAAFGPEFSVGLLLEVSDIASAEVDAGIAKANEAGFLLSVGREGDRFRFSHALVRETLHGAMDPDARRQVHMRIGLALEKEYGVTADEHLAELAYHFFEARLDGEDRKAVDYNRRAAAGAFASLAYEEAARFLRMALRALGGDQAPVGSERAELLLLLGDAEARAGDFKAARTTFLRAAAIARETADGVRLARAALGYGGRFIWSRAGGDADLVPLLQDAIAMLADTDEALGVRLRARLACAWRGSPEHFNEGATLTQQALETARRLGDPATLSYALVGRFWATLWPHNPTERLGIAREVLAVAEGAADLERAIDGHQVSFITYVELGMMLEATAQLATVGRVAAELRQPPQLWAMRTYETVLALLEGDFDHASKLVEAEEMSPSINPIGDQISTNRMHRFLLRREQGRLTEEEAIVRSSVREFPWYPYHRPALVCLLLDLDRADEARVVFDDLARDDFRVLYRDCEWLLETCLASESCVRLGDANAAEVLYRQLLPFAGRNAIAHAEGSVGAVDRYLGLLAAAAGRVDDAERHLEDGIRVSQRMGAHPWVAHTQVDLAELLDRRGEPADIDRAAELMHDARKTARRLGMTRLVGRLAPEPAATVAEAPRTAPTAPSSPAASGRAGIFHREGEYWSVGLDGANARVRDSKGMRYLGLLIARPGAEMHVLDLVSAELGSYGATISKVAAAADGLVASKMGDAGEMLDPEARQAYRERLRELDLDISQAEDWNDPERLERLQSEREFLMQELAAAVGLGGRSRVAASAAERARLNVGKAIRSSIQRIDAYSPALGAHLGVAVHTGTFCAYTPDPGLSISWDL